MKPLFFASALSALLCTTASRPAAAQPGTGDAPEPSALKVNELYYGRKLEPKGQRNLHGIGQSGDAFDEYYAAIGAHKPALYMTYISIKADDPKKPPRAKWFSDLKTRLEKYDVYVIPQIGVSLGKVQEVVDGKHDAGIEALCEGLKSLNRPAYLRIGYEFNGEWNNLPPEQFKAAWKRIVDAMRRHKLDEVATVWCYAPEGVHKNYMDYYPGDDYVDWWGIDLFSVEHFFVADTKWFVEEAAKRRFPVMVGESTPRWVGVDRGDKSWQTWFARYFEWMGKYPNVKAFSYITYDWAAKWKSPMHLHDWGDARVWTNEAVFDKWKAEMNKPVYLHGADEATTRAMLNLPPRAASPLVPIGAVVPQIPPRAATPPMPARVVVPDKQQPKPR